MKNRDKILDILTSEKGFVSGEDMSRTLGVSRAAISKNIKQLREEGYKIHAVTNKGYQFEAEPEHISERQFKYELGAYGFTYVQIDDTVDSTNLEARRRSYEIQGNGCFLASEQVAGRGRRGREWASPKNQGCYMSLLLHPKIMPANAAMITLIAGVALAETLRELYQVEAWIKWPNDVVVNGKKIAGILTEMNAEVDCVNYLVVGIGLNVGNKAFPEELQNIATYLEYVMDGKSKSFHQFEYAQALISKFIPYVERFNQTHNLEFIKAIYEKMCVNIQREVVVEGKPSFKGVGKGITEQGALTVINEQGECVTVTSGEASVRGIYGYV